MSETYDSDGFRTFTVVKCDGGPAHGQDLHAKPGQPFQLGSTLRITDALGEGYYIVEEPIGYPWGPEYAWAHWQGA